MGMLSATSSKASLVSSHWRCFRYFTVNFHMACEKALNSTPRDRLMYSCYSWCDRRQIALIICLCLAAWAGLKGLWKPKIVQCSWYIQLIKGRGSPGSVTRSVPPEFQASREQTRAKQQHAQYHPSAACGAPQMACASATAVSYSGSKKRN